MEGYAGIHRGIGKNTLRDTQAYIEGYKYGDTGGGGGIQGCLRDIYIYIYIHVYIYIYRGGKRSM